MASVGHFFSTLFETDDKTHARNYAEAVRRGSSVVAVDTSDDSEVEKAESVMGLLGTINTEDRAAQWKNEGWSGFDANSEPRKDVDVERISGMQNMSDPDRVTRKS